MQLARQIENSKGRGERPRRGPSRTETVGRGADRRVEPGRVATGSVRTCVACRQPAARSDLVRLVSGPGGQVAVDARAREDGRGAWVHPTRACVVQAAKRHAAERSLRMQTVAVDPEALIEGMREGFRRRLASLLSAARGKGALAVGAAATAEALEKVQASLLVLASDAGAVANAIGQEAFGEQDAKPAGVRVYGTKSELGALLGRGEVAVVAVTDAQVARELMSMMDRLAGLEAEG